MRVKGAVASLLAATLIAVLATVTAAADTSALAAGTVAETGSLASSGLANTEGAKDDPIVIRNLQNVQGGKKGNPKKNNNKNNNKNNKNNKNKKKGAVKKADAKAKKEFQVAKEKWIKIKKKDKKDKMNKKDNTKKLNKKDNKKKWKNKGKKAGNDTKKLNKQIKKFNHSGNKKINKKAKKAGKKGKKGSKAGKRANKVKKAKSARQKANLSRVWSKCPKFTPTSNHTCNSTLPSACAYGGYCAGANFSDACVRRQQCSCDESGKFSCVQHPNCTVCSNKPSKAPTTKKAKKGSKAARKADLSRKWAKCPTFFTPTSKHSCSSTLPSCTYKGWCAGDNVGDSCVPRTECVCEDTGKFACKTKGVCSPCDSENRPPPITIAHTKSPPIPAYKRPTIVPIK